MKIDPSYFAAAASLAALDMADKKPADAKKRFEALLAINPKNAQALLALAQLAAAKGPARTRWRACWARPSTPTRPRRRRACC